MCLSETTFYAKFSQCHKTRCFERDTHEILMRYTNRYKQTQRDTPRYKHMRYTDRYKHDVTNEIHTIFNKDTLRDTNRFTSLLADLRHACISGNAPVLHLFCNHPKRFTPREGKRRMSPTWRCMRRTLPTGPPERERFALPQCMAAVQSRDKRPERTRPCNG